MKKEEIAQEILVSVKGASKLEGENKEEISLITSGKRLVTAQGFELRYEEVDPDSQEISQTLVQVSDGGRRVVMEKLGDYQTSMVFEKGKSYHSHYNTPFGALEMTLYPIEVQCEMGERNGKIHLQYQLTIQGTYVALHNIDILYVLKDGESTFEDYE